MKLTTITLIFCGLLFIACNTENESKSEQVFKIDYQKFTLENGLEVILHEDHSDPIVAVGTLMHVGSNREKPGKTGFAHFFEHMSFNDSENVPVGANRKTIPEWGGSRNGGTNSDYTVYYEVVPKDAFEKIMWIDSDRFGYMINTVTEAALEREKQVVKNEKRQNYDNVPYGYTNEIVRKNLYPEGHPYSWTTIGALPDLQAATIDDVKEFYDKYYGASNATLVIAGDIDIEETKLSVKKWFGEIRKGPDVEKLEVAQVVLDSSKSLYFEDNFAKLPELRITIPTVENYHQDMYALDVLAELLSGSKKSPLYEVIVEEKKLAPNVSAYQINSELAGEFIFRVRANSGVALDSVHTALFEGLKRFEANGISENDIKRIKAELETNLYKGISTVLNKAFQLAQDNEFNGDAGHITQKAQLYDAVTIDDVMRVYNEYIKNKPFVMTSMVPKGHLELAVSGASEATVWVEEVKQVVVNEEVSQGEEAVYEKTPSKHDRSEPPFGDLPMFKSPTIWTGSIDNGLTLYGIENNEVPLVEFDITIPGGLLLDPVGKEGVANLLSDMMMQGTATKTAAALEEAIGLLGANISISSSNEYFRISGSCLTRNFEATLSLVKEIILQPRWDESEFNRLKQALETELKGREASARGIAYISFIKQLYGNDHPFGVPNSGTLNSTKDISLDDLKAYYNNLSPSQANFHIAGAIDQAEVERIVSVLNDWEPKDIEIPKFQLPETTSKDVMYFANVPGAKQSVLYIGKLVLSAENEDANKLKFANEILGGGSSGRLTQTLRIEKGYTYGAFSTIIDYKEVSPFLVGTSVRANATLKSLEIIEDMLANYATTYSQSDADITENKLLKDNTRAFESLGAKLNLLRTMSEYNKPKTYVEDEQQELIAMTLEDYQAVISKYLQEEDMIYVVVGDKATQFEEVKKLGKPIIELDIYGDEILIID